MITIDCLQGSDEWFQARLGVPTSSEFNKIITPSKMEPSKSAGNYINKLLAEWLSGKPDESFKSDWMKRGHEMEGEARDYYAFNKDVTVTQIGFLLDDARRYGCSPDGLVNDDGGLEIKCCSPGVHLGYLLKGDVPIEHRLQILGSILVTDREWWDFISYEPNMQPLIVRTHKKRVISELRLLEQALIVTNKKIYDKKQILIERGLKIV